MLVLDGNQKNRRDVCFATEAGAIAYEGLPWTVKSGCQLSPSYRSKYCFHHAGRVCNDDSKSNKEEPVVMYIIGKRTTKSGVRYQVRALIMSNVKY